MDQPLQPPELSPQPPEQPQPMLVNRRRWLYIGISLFVAVAAGIVIWWQAGQVDNDLKQATNQSQPVVPTGSTATPQLTTEVVVSGRDHVWDIAFLPSGEMLFNERSGTVSVKTREGKVNELAKITDVKAAGEGGLLGLTVDPEFSENSFIYTCFNSTQGDIRVVRWKVDAAVTGLSGRTDIITGMPASSGGRHSGCRLTFGPDGYLWVGAGDSANETTSQSPTSLGGKILRVDRDGKAGLGNLQSPFDPRIYSYGHRNTQGLAFRNKLGISVEHGSTTDDEVNLLVTGNFGWAPGAGYSERGVAMTDKARFPDAVGAIWSSSTPTQAPSGAVFLSGTQWKAWDGTLAIAMLKARHLKILHIDGQNKVTKEEKVLGNQFGRLRAAVQGPDGSLYVSTDNGSSTDQIVRVTPH